MTPTFNVPVEGNTNRISPQH